MVRIVKAVAVSALVVLSVFGCAKSPGQSIYEARNVGKSAVLNYATVISSRSIDIVGRQTGTGGAIGAAVGASAGSGFGSGSGSLVGVGVGLVAGALIGAALEQDASDRKGVEYTVELDNGILMSLAQELPETGQLFQSGDRVIMQTSGGYQRLLPAGVAAGASQ